MTPRQIKEMKHAATFIGAVIACAGIVWLVFQFEAHKSAHKLSNKAFIELIK